MTAEKTEHRDDERGEGSHHERLHREPCQLHVQLHALRLQSEVQGKSHFRGRQELFERHQRG